MIEFVANWPPPHFFLPHQIPSFSRLQDTPLPASAAAAAAAAATAPPRASRLLGIDWSLGVSVQSSASAGVGRPFASVQMRVVRPDGSRAIESVEMSLQQLKGFEASLREAALALERA